MVASTNLFSILTEDGETNIIGVYSLSVTDSVGLDDDVANVDAQGFITLVKSGDLDDAEIVRSTPAIRAVLNINIGTRLFSGYIIDAVKYKYKPTLTNIRAKRTADKELAVESIKSEIENGLKHVIKGSASAEIMKQADRVLSPQENLGQWVDEIANTSINKTDYGSYIDVLNDLGIVIAREDPTDLSSPYILVPLNDVFKPDDSIGKEIIENAVQSTLVVDMPRYLFRPAAVNNINVKCSFRSSGDLSEEKEVAAINKTGVEHYVSTVTTNEKRAKALVIIEYEKLLSQSAILKLTIPGSIDVFTRSLITFPDNHWIRQQVWKYWRITTVKHNWQSGAYTTDIAATPTHDPDGEIIEEIKTVIK